MIYYKIIIYLDGLFMIKRFFYNIILKRLLHQVKIFLTKIRLIIFIKCYPPSRKNGLKLIAYVYEDNSYIEIRSGLHLNSLCFSYNYCGYDRRDFENFDELMKYLMKIKFTDGFHKKEINL